MTVALKKRLHLSLRARDTARPGDPKPVTGVDKKKKKKKKGDDNDIQNSASLSVGACRQPTTTPALLPTCLIFPPRSALSVSPTDFWSKKKKKFLNGEKRKQDDKAANVFTVVSDKHWQQQQQQTGGSSPLLLFISLPI